MNAIKNRTFAIGAVLVMCLTALTCVNITSDDSDAYGPNPLVGFVDDDYNDHNTGDYWILYGTYVDVTITSWEGWDLGFLSYRYFNGSSWTSWQSVDWNGSVTVNGLTIVGYGHIYGNITGYVDIEWSTFCPDAELEEGGWLNFSCQNYDTEHCKVNQSYSHTYIPDFDYYTGFSVSGGSLPPGLALTKSGDNYVVSGTPTTTGTYYVTFDVSEWNDEAGEEVGGYMSVRYDVTQAVSYTHTVTYSANGGTGSVSSTVVTDTNNGNTNVTLAANGFTKAGYTFIGWKVGNTTYQPGQNVPVGANGTVTATAQWSQNTLNATANNISGVSGQAYSNQIGASANNGGTVSYAVKSCTGGTATVNSSGLVTYTAPSVSSTTSFTVTVTVTGTFAQGGNLTRDVLFTVTVDPVLSFTNAATSGTLSVKGA